MFGFCVEGAPSGAVGHDDLLIVGPGVLGRLVAEKWRQVLFYQFVAAGVFLILSCYSSYNSVPIILDDSDLDYV